ncbi:hypothetical protein V3331_18110 [Gaopeijia maritima]|uniref:hypothetical protein n=1 Tax=Gaopeijia maritima TaxID=3119007 RepID=UPI003250F7BD
MNEQPAPLDPRTINRPIDPETRVRLRQASEAVRANPSFGRGALFVSSAFLILCVVAMGLSALELLRGAEEPGSLLAMLGVSTVLSGCFSWIIARNRKLQQRADSIAHLME